MYLLFRYGPRLVRQRYILFCVVLYNSVSFSLFFSFFVDPQPNAMQHNAMPRNFIPNMYTVILQKKFVHAVLIEWF